MADYIQYSIDVEYEDHAMVELKQEQKLLQHQHWASTTRFVC